MSAAATALAAIPDAVALGFAATGFEADAFRRAATDPHTAELALVAAYLAGVSQAAGHAVVLFLNRVPPGRFVLSLALMGAVYLAGAILTAAATLAVAELAFGRAPAFWPTIAVVALAHAPRLVGVLILAPYLGELLDRALGVWVLMLTLFGLHHGLGLPAHAAAALAVLGWAVVRTLSVVLGGPLGVAIGAARRAAAGGPLTLDAANVVDTLKARARDAAAQRREGGGE